MSEQAAKKVFLQIDEERARRELLLVSADIKELKDSKGLINYSDGILAAERRYGDEEARQLLKDEVTAAGFTHPLVTASMLLGRGWSDGNIKKLLFSESFEITYVTKYSSMLRLYPAIVALGYEKQGLGLKRSLAKTVEPTARLAAIATAREALVGALKIINAVPLRLEIGQAEAELFTEWRKQQQDWPRKTIVARLSGMQSTTRAATELIVSLRDRASRTLFDQRVAEIATGDYSALPEGDRNRLINSYYVRMRFEFPAGSPLAPQREKETVRALIDDMLQTRLDSAPGIVFDAGRLPANHPSRHGLDSCVAAVKKVMAKGKLGVVAEPSPAEWQDLQSELADIAAGYRRCTNLEEARRELVAGQLEVLAQDAGRRLVRRRAERVEGEVRAVIASFSDVLPDEWVAHAGTQTLFGLGGYLPDATKTAIIESLRQQTLNVLAEATGASTAELEALREP